MYARGMSAREIRGHLEELYGIDVSPDLISAVTDAVLEEVAEWEGRPLEACYPLVFFDAIQVKIGGRGLRQEQGGLYRARHPGGRQQGDPGHLDRADGGRQVLAQSHERAEEPRRRSILACRKAAPTGSSRFLRIRARHG